jgi:hypothetical protein
VPRERAEEVARIAWHVAKGGKAGRRKLYGKMGMKPGARHRSADHAARRASQ